MLLCIKTSTFTVHLISWYPLSQWGGLGGVPRYCTWIFFEELDTVVNDLLVVKVGIKHLIINQTPSIGWLCNRTPDYVASNSSSSQDHSETDLKQKL